MYTLNCKGHLISLDRPLIMGVINANADSFYSGSRAPFTETIVQRAAEMLTEGADMIDIGGQSTRPGSKRIGAQEEIQRTAPAIERILDRFPDALISIDTYFAEVARAAVNAGAAIVNDISGGDMDADMIDTVAGLQTPYICMHMQGTPERMQDNPHYEDVTATVLDYLVQKVTRCRAAGIGDIIIDPGFGFGKTIHHNFTLLKNLSALEMMQCPILAGLSRKSTIYKVLKVKPEEALNGTTVLNTIALMNGAHILRVHDVKEAREAITLFMAYQRG